MQRSSFIRLFAAAGSLLAVPFAGHAKRRSQDRADKGFKVGSGKDRSDKAISLMEGDTFYTKVSSQDTNGDLYVFESTRVKKGGPPLHVHAAQDELWYVLEGEFSIKVGDTIYEAKAGDTVFGPRGVPHAFSKTNEGSARLLMSFQPAGKMEEYFIAASEGRLAKMSAAEQDAFRKAHGFEKVGPALNYEKKP